MNYLNIYYCEDCDEEWEDEWSCMCNDKCPECGKEHEERNYRPRCYTVVKIK